MSTLVVIEYDDPYKAEEMRLRLRRMEKDFRTSLSHEDEAKLQAALDAAKQ